jgi:glycosyltransferase involved in cell wall biosynthesis
MLVGIEASAALGTRRTGVGNYVAHVIAGLQRLSEAQDELRFVYFSNRCGEEPSDHDAPLPSARLYTQDRLPSRMLWLQFGLPRSVARTRPDIVHFPNHLGPVVRDLDTPFVVTIHDMSVYRFPHFHHWKTVSMHRLIIPALARRTCLILTVSESARHDIVHYLRVPPEKVRVVYEGVAPRFQPTAPADGPPATEVAERYGLSFPYVLTVGTLEPRKNHARLIDAFTSLVRQERIPHHLVIVGEQGWKTEHLRVQVEERGDADRIHFLGYVPTRDLPYLYRAASAFAFPSLYEGFGLPVLEALACGTPTLISNDPALTEVAGQGTVVVADPRSVQDIATGLYNLLSDEALSARLGQSGLERARGFSWDRCAAQTLDLYREALSNGHSGFA